MVLIKKNVLSASIATVLLGSTGAFAANDRGFTSDTDWSEEQAGFNGHVGTTFEYETKSTDNRLQPASAGQCKKDPLHRLRRQRHVPSDPDPRSQGLRDLRQRRAGRQLL